MACTKRKFLPLHSPSFVGFREGLARPSRHFEQPELYASEAGGRKTRRGVFRTFPTLRDANPPIAGGRTPPYGSHLGKESRVCCIAGKGGRLCRVTPARTATSAACSQSRSSWCAKAAGRRYPWGQVRALHAGAPPLRRRSSSPPRLHPQIKLLDRIDELLARMDAKLCVHVFHVALRRVLRDDQLVGNVSDCSAARK